MIPNSKTILPVFYLACLLSRAQGTGNDSLWAPAEPVWAGEEADKIRQLYSNTAENRKALGTRPATVGELCKEPATASHPADEKSRPDLALIRSYCDDKSSSRILSLKSDFGAYPIGQKYPIGKVFEKFGSNWSSYRVDPEIARAWNEVPAAIQTELGYPVTSNGYLHFRFGLRRDLSAWQQDRLGLNLPLSEKEIDVNEPSQGYFHYENPAMAFSLGRFPVHWSPSPDFGLALSNSVPYHNAAEFALKSPHARYRFLVSSLNPWLEGTPPGDSSSEDYPPGSEQYLQRHYQQDHGAGNFHKRVYAENIKTLFAHRLEGEWGPVGLGITETQVIGGKVPDLRDAGPFVIFHNDFKDGYTNSALSLDATVRLPAGFSLAGELYIDDVQYAETERDGNTASLLGYLAAVRHAFTARGWALLQSLHAIRTDPYLYGYLQPLNTMSSRHILASNNQRDGDAGFVDRYVVDYPIGYLRGGDAFDFWYRLDAWRGRLRLAVSLALLQQGEVDLHTPYQDYYTSGHDAPTGVVEREFRAGLDGSYRFSNRLSANGGAAWNEVSNENHIRGGETGRFRVNLGLSCAVLR